MSSDHLEHTCLDIEDHGSLAAALGDTPETVIAVHLLHRGFACAYVAGRPARFEAAIIRNLAFNRDELTGFGAALPMWELLRERHGWSSVEVDPSIASQLAELLEFASGRPVSFLDDIYHVLRQPVWPARVETVRLLSPADSGLLERAPPDLRGRGGDRRRHCCGKESRRPRSLIVRSSRLLTLPLAPASTPTSAWRHCRLGAIEGWLQPRRR